MLASKIPENRDPEDVRTSPVRSWKVPGEFISLPGSSEEVVGGFGAVLVRVYEVLEVILDGWDEREVALRRLNSVLRTRS